MMHMITQTLAGSRVANDINNLLLATGVIFFIKLSRAVYMFGDEFKKIIHNRFIFPAKGIG